MGRLPASMTLQNDPTFVESTREGILLSNPEVEDSKVSPHQFQIVIAFDLQKQPPVSSACTQVPHFGPPVARRIAAVDAV
jgi:hypothetical protein